MPPKGLAREWPRAARFPAAIVGKGADDVKD
jgi:hypothetical protein